MKILCIIDSLGSGGAQKQLVELAIGFNKIHDVSFLIYHKETFYYHTLEKENINITCIEEPSYLKRFMKMRRFIRTGNFDVVLSFLAAANFISQLSGLPYRKWKLIVGERSANPNILKSFRLKAYRWFHFFSDCIVANSHTNLNIILSINPILNKKKCKVIYNLIDFEYIDNELETIKQQKSSILRIVVAAGHRSLKNLNGLIEAVKRLNIIEQNKIVIDWFGDIIDNSYYKAKNKIEEYGLNNRIILHKATHNIIEEMIKADAIGLFSFYEGLPNTVCEGMACKKVIICSKVSDLPNILENEFNLLFDPNSIESIKESLKSFINLTTEQRIKIGLENRKKAEFLFKKDKVLTKYIDLFKNEK